MKHSILKAAILGILGLGAISPAIAAPYPVQLCAGEFQKTLADGSSVPMWGYARMPLGTTDCGTLPATAYSSPGPRIDVPEANDSLVIILRNGLPRPTSLVIPGATKVNPGSTTAAPMSPVFVDQVTTSGVTTRTRLAAGASAMGQARVISFDAETPPGGMHVYAWSLSNGSHMYHSGTNPQVQVQMGLYGAATTDAVQGSVAYPDTDATDTVDDSVTYADDVVLFYSEIDRNLHVDVVDGLLPNYDGLDSTSTIHYAPKDFMIDVQTAGSSTGITFNPETKTLVIPNGSKSLVRFFNAGQRTHTPTVTSGDFTVVAEDGRRYPNAREQYTVELPPLKARDAILDLSASTATGGSNFTIFDSMMALSSPDPNYGTAVSLAAGDIANGDGNGMLIKVTQQAASGFVGGTSSADAPVAVRDGMSVQEGGGIANILALAMANDSYVDGTVGSILSYPVHGELISNGSGYDYQHDGSEGESDSMVYQLTSAAGETSMAGVVIAVAPINDAPVAVNDSVSARVGQTIEIRALANDSDADSDSLRITAVDASSLGTAAAQDLVIVFEAVTVGEEDLAYSIADPSGATAQASIHIAVTEAAAATSDSLFTANTSGRPAAAETVPAPTAKRDSYKVAKGGVIEVIDPILGVLANDTRDATVNTTLVKYPVHGAVMMNADGTFTYTHDGSEADDDLFVYEIYNAGGSDTGRVRINVK